LQQSSPPTTTAVPAGRILRRGAEADIYLTEWYGKPAISKIRTPRAYRHKLLDEQIRKYRTVHEAQIMSQAKLAAEVRSPFVYFVDPVRAEIIMEFVSGKNAKDVLTPEICKSMGRYAGRLHAAGIIHGDLTTSNFIVNGRRLVLLDFGLAYYSERTEDRAVDIRLIKEVFSSAHVQIFKKAFDSFVSGYAAEMGKRKAEKVLENVAEIEKRGRYARFQV
jgi:TP53 regulating kinase-like protein